MSDDRNEWPLGFSDLLTNSSVLVIPPRTRWARFRRFLRRLTRQEWTVGESVSGGRYTFIRPDKADTP